MLVPACAGSGGVDEPRSVRQSYGGLHDRDVAALSPSRIEDLLAGRGAGYALAAELNHYPGPLHALELADQLHLTGDQEAAVRDVRTAMLRQARTLGRRLVSLERSLDHAFESGIITPAMLDGLARRIAVTEGRLRAAHLAAHLEVEELLMPHQIRSYDRLRGYSGTSDSASPDHGSDHEDHQEN